MSSEESRSPGNRTIGGRLRSVTERRTSRWGSILVPYLTGRLIVIGALLSARYLDSHIHPSESGVHARVSQGLLGWDAGWYQAIAAHGYGGVARQALRFFPLYPELATIAHSLTSLSAGFWLIAFSNVAMLGALFQLHAFAEKISSRQVATITIWLASVSLVALVTTMGYAEGVYLLFVATSLLSVANGKYATASLAGLLAGLTRPLGVLLAIPPAVLILQSIIGRPPKHSSSGPPSRETGQTATRSLGARSISALALCALAPVAGGLSYLAWSWWRFGDFWLPLSLQTASSRRGGLSDPISTMKNDFNLLVHGHHIGTALHMPWLILAGSIAVIAFWKLPLPFSAFGAATIAVSASSSNLDSFERYALSALPLLVVGAILLKAKESRTSIDSNQPLYAVIAIFAASTFAYSLLAFMNMYVP